MQIWIKLLPSVVMLSSLFLVFMFVCRDGTLIVVQAAANVMVEKKVSNGSIINKHSELQSCSTYSPWCQIKSTIDCLEPLVSSCMPHCTDEIKTILSALCNFGIVCLF